MIERDKEEYGFEKINIGGEFFCQPLFSLQSLASRAILILAAVAKCAIPVIGIFFLDTLGPFAYI